MYYQGNQGSHFHHSGRGIPSHDVQQNEIDEWDELDDNVAGDLHYSYEQLTHRAGNSGYREDVEDLNHAYWSQDQGPRDAGVHYLNVRDATMKLISEKGAYIPSPHGDFATRTQPHDIPNSFQQ